MANKKITDIDTITSINDTDKIVMTETDTSVKRISYANLMKSVNDKINSNTSHLNDIEKKKAEQYYIDIIKDYGATCDNITDISGILQKAINEINSKGGGVLFLPRFENNSYRFSNIILKKGVSIESNNATIKPIDDINNDLFLLDNGAISNQNYTLKIKGLNIIPNENNTSQKIFNFSAKTTSNNGGGLWHFLMEDVTIWSLNNDQIGIYLYANDSENSNYDVVNQYCRFKNINIYRKSKNSKCLYIKGQIGQTHFDDCEFNGNDVALDGFNVYIESIEGSSNDYVLGALSFKNTTFQWSKYGIYANYCSSLKLEDCWLEKLVNAICIDNGTNLELDNCHFSELGDSNGIETPIVIGNQCKLTGDNNYIKGCYGRFIVQKENTINRGMTAKFNIWRDSSYPYLQFEKTTPVITPTSTTLNAYRYSNLAISLTSNFNLQNIVSEHSESESLTIINLSTDNTKYIVINSNFGVDDGKIILPYNIDNIKIYYGQSVTLKKISIDNSRKWIIINTTGNITYKA